MITMKFAEIRDHGTCISGLALRVINSTQLEQSKAEFSISRLLGRVGFWGSCPSTILINLGTMRTASDPYSWKDRTMIVAHNWLDTHWNCHDSGDVVDVRYILGETDNPAKSEFTR